MVPEDGSVTGGLADWLYNEAPFGLLAQDSSPEPVFIYANKAAQSFFECGPRDLIGMPASLSAPEVNRAARQELMGTVLNQGYRAGYRGIRKTLSGRLFWIEDVTIWNLVEEAADIHGQAALIRRVRPA